MRLTRVTITGYRSIQKTESIILDEKISVLIGANDHGKTNILYAIKCLNQDNPIMPDDRNWDLQDTDIVKIQWHFTIDPDFIDKFSQKNNVLKIDNVTTEPLKEGVDVQPLAVLSTEEVPTYFETNNDSELVFYRDSTETDNKVHLLSTPFKIAKDKEAEIIALIPRVELFEPPKTNLVDRVNISQIETLEFEFMQGIFILAGLWEKRSEIFIENDMTSKLLKDASKKLTNVLNNKWKQGKNLIWELRHVANNGDHIEIKIQDPAVKGRFTRPSLRSAGFQTYFLISMIILARTQNNKGKFIFLFDEPGTYLHPQAQLDLQRTFEIISDDAQLVYTTHSLFLISKNYPNRNIVVSKTDEGTKINEKPFLKNWKAVRDSLGILLSNNFLIADKTLLTEGPSDVIYILSTIRILKNANKVDIDLNDLSIVDAGSQSNYIAMAKIMLSEGRSIVALLDGDKSGDDIEVKLKKTCEKELKEKNLQIHKLPKGKSIEDIFTHLDILKAAIKGTTNYLIDKKIRELKDGIKLDQEIEKIKTTSSKTLGKSIDEITSSMFVKEEKLSKLLIALNYEDKISKAKYEPSSEAQDNIASLKSLLSLRGEKSAEKSIFETVPHSTS